jgi:putative two-component system response regulator
MASNDLRTAPAARILLAEHPEADLRQIAQHLEEAGYHVLQAADGEEALRLVRHDDPDLMIFGVGVPRLNAFQLCERLQAHPTTQSIPVILIVSPDAQAEKIRGLEMGVEDFLNRPVNKYDLLARVKSVIRVRRLQEQVQITEKVVFELAKMLESKMASSSSSGDSQRLAHYAVELGRAADLGEEDLELLRRGAILHDIGKIAVREEVLKKTGRLSNEEFDEIKLHPEMGERICGTLPDADLVLPMIRHQRERWDGSGYPDGLRGEQIPLLARILAIADAYDAMLSTRPYRPALSQEQARESIRAGAGTQWDPHLVGLFLESMEQRPEASS